MLTLEKDQLVIRFPEIHPDAVCTISFQRTLRIPDDNRLHHLPPGLGNFPLFHVDDYAGKLPPEWSRHGGVFFPMYQAEAMWIRFHSQYPFAVKIAAGKINAVSGEAWKPELQPAERFVGHAHDMLARPPQQQAEYLDYVASLPAQRVTAQQDYVTIPGQPWLDGFNVGEGQVRQFVAMPLGEGYTVEGQLTGEELHGGLQLIVYPLKPEFYQSRPRSILRSAGMLESYASAAVAVSACSASAQMGLAAGGLMKQSIYQDSLGYEKWDQNHSARCFVHLLNSEQFAQVTGRQPPTPAPTAADYTKASLPWFDYYAEGLKAIPGAPNLKGIDSVATLGHKKGENPLPENEPVIAPTVIPLGKKSNVVRQGQF